MFTSNDKAINYCKRDGPGRNGLAELVGSHHDPPQSNNVVNSTPPEDILLKKSPTHHDARIFSSPPDYEVPDLQRRVRFEPRKATNFDVEDQSSLSSAEHAFGGTVFHGKESLRTPPAILTRPECANKAGGHAEDQHNNVHGPNQLLLQLRAALSEKELQLVELREQHIVVLSRAADARHNWVAALQSKDRVIVQLQRTLKHHKSQHDRQMRENQEHLHALRKRQKQGNAEVERKDLRVALLETKNAQFVQELMEQQKIVTGMKRHIDEKEKSCAKYHHQKLKMMSERIQDLKSALQMKEEEVTRQAKYCNELKTRLWKRDSIIAQLQLSEQQLQSSLAREEAAREAQSMSRENIMQVEENSAPNEKGMSEMENQHKIQVGNEDSPNKHLEREHHHQCEIRKLMELKDNFSNVQGSIVKDLNDKEGVMHRIQKRMPELQRSLRSKDMALSDRNKEYQEALMEIQRLTEEYEAMKHECEKLNRRNYQLESTIAHMQYPDRQMGASASEVPTPPVEVLSYEFSQGGSTGEDLGFDDAVQDSIMEWEQLSNASVYHANFEKIKIIEVEMPDIDQQQQQRGITQIQPPHSTFQSPSPARTRIPLLPSAATVSPQCVRPPLEREEPPSTGPPNKDVGPGIRSEFEENYNSIQDEIKKREQCWRKTEELMREALTRRMKLLGESKSNQVKTPKAQSTLNHQHHLQASTRGDTAGRKQGTCSRMPRQNQERRHNQKRTPHLKVVHHGHKSSVHHHHRQEAAYEQESLDYQLDHCRLNHNVGKGDRRRHEQHERKYSGEQTQNMHLEDTCARYSHHGRRGRVV